jgi:hypothetical protein
MKEEYNYTLTVPLTDTAEVLELLEEVRMNNPGMRLSRKPDTSVSARFYLSFPFKNNRTDLQFSDWMDKKMKKNWDLFGPNYGVWGFNM